MRRRTIALLGVFNVFALFALTLMIVALARYGDLPSALQQACLEGANDEAPLSGATQPVSRGFETIAEAEAFICHQIAYPREPRGWHLEDVSATRIGPAADVARGHGFAAVSLNYALRHSRADLRIDVSPFAMEPITFGIFDRVRIMDAEAEVIRGNDPLIVLVQWQSRGYSFHVLAQLAEDFTLEDLYAVLRSIR